MVLVKMLIMRVGVVVVALEGLAVQVEQGEQVQPRAMRLGVQLEPVRRVVQLVVLAVRLRVLLETLEMRRALVVVRLALMAAPTVTVVQEPLAKL